MGKQSILAGHGQNNGVDRMRRARVYTAADIGTICEGWEVIPDPDDSHAHFVLTAKNIALYNGAKDGPNPDSETIDRMVEDLERVSSSIEQQMGKKKYSESLWPGLFDQYKPDDSLD